MDFRFWDDKIKLENLHPKLCEASSKFRKKFKNSIWWAFEFFSLVQSNKNSMSRTLPRICNETLLSLWMSDEWILIVRRSRFKTICTLSYLFKKDFFLSQVSRWRIIIILRFGKGNEYDELKWSEEKLWSRNWIVQKNYFQIKRWRNKKR